MKKMLLPKASYLYSLTTLTCVLSLTSVSAHSRDIGTLAQRPSVYSNSNITLIPSEQEYSSLSELCAQVNDVAMNENREPVGNCTESSGSLTNVYTTPTSDSQSEEPTEIRDVAIFVHGFSLSGGLDWFDVPAHNCREYWGPQGEELREQDWTVDLVGFYPDNRNCNNLEGSEEFGINTPIEDIAYILRNYLLENYSYPADRISLVAHSLGGLVVRKLLDDYGHELYINKVITLGTPHDGVYSLMGNCWFVQCTQASSVGSFIANLEHNPQSLIDTQWYLVATDADQTIGQSTGTLMQNDSSSKPFVVRYTYRHYHRYVGSSVGLGHGDIHGENATKSVRRYLRNGSNYEVDNPHTRLMDYLFD